MINDIPGITVEYDDSYNPMVISTNAPYGITFYMTRKTMLDVEVYKNFLDNAIAGFRHSLVYKTIKSDLIEKGLDHCQVMSNITEEEVGASGLEMHHNFLTIFDIALLITEHVLKTVGIISTFDLMYLLELEHREHRVPLVMLSESVHQMYHNNEDLIIPASMTTGNWLDLLQRYNKGITLRIAEKVSNFINESINNDSSNSQVLKELLAVRDYAESWGRYNEYSDNRKSIISDNSNQYNYNMPYLEQKY